VLFGRRRLGAGRLGAVSTQCKYRHSANGSGINKNHSKTELEAGLIMLIKYASLSEIEAGIISECTLK